MEIASIADHWRRSEVTVGSIEMTTKVLKGSVKGHMSADLVSLQAGATMHEAIEMMVTNRVSALPIVDQAQRCVGIITTTDLVEVTYDIDDDFRHTDTTDPSARRRLVESLSAAIGNEPVASYCSEKVEAVSEAASLSSAASKMAREQLHHLPVVDSSDRLVGILSSMDVVAAVADGDA